MAGLNVDSLIAKYGAPEPEFTVTIGDDSFRFRAVTDFDELQNLKEGFAEILQTIKGKACPPKFAPYKDASAHTIMVAYFISATLIEPKWSHVDVMKLAKHCGFLVEGLFNEMNRRQIAITAEADAKQLNDLKND